MAKRPIYEETSEETASYDASTVQHLPTHFSMSIGELTQVQCENIIELQYAIYSLFRDNFKGLELKEKSYSVELLVPMANGNTGIVTIQSKSEEDMVTYRERGY
jgi:hypothetical protein